VRDEQGMIWYLDFATATLRRIDPRTGAVKEWDPPVMKPGYPLGALGLELDSDGNPWLARVFQAGVMPPAARWSARRRWCYSRW
jgi:streptogramin lyase